MYNKQRGFTLVEIAIVLVIIGLLLGGILKGQELITSARVRNLADQNSGLQAAYYGFIDRYRQVPGDMTPGGARGACNVIGSAVPGCPSAGVGGDGNGRINKDDWGESSALWAHLSSSGFIQGAYTGGATDDATYTAQTVAPINAFNGRLLLTRSKDYTGIGGGVNYRLMLFVGLQVPVNVMRELDLKIDDGSPDTGVLRNSTTGAAMAPAQTAAACTKDVGGTKIWDIDTNEQDCTAAYLY